MLPTILFVTTNAGKLREAQDILRDSFTVEQANMAYPELQEDDLGRIAAHGARYCAAAFGREVIVEDSGLFVDALQGFPGPYSAYVQRTLGNRGVLKLMEGIEGRGAEFRSYVGYCAPGGEPVTFPGAWRGDILYAEAGLNGFGYDPIFSSGGRPVGEMSLAEKNAASHRRISLARFKAWYLSSRTAGPT